MNLADIDKFLCICYIQMKKRFSRDYFLGGSTSAAKLQTYKPNTVAKFKYINNTLLVSSTLLLFCGPHITYFHLTKGRVTFFRLETIVASFLHLMV